MSRIIDSIYTNNACTKVMLYMTWGYKTGWAEREEINTFDAMADSVRKGYEYVSQFYDVPIVPVGGVWKEVFHASTIDLHQEDEQHPTEEGSYLIASTFYASLFKSLPNEFYRGKIKKEDAKYLQKMAFDYVTTHLDTFKLNRNTIELKVIEDKPRKIEVEVEAVYPDAISYSWNFGDGKSSIDSIVTHTFTKPGFYKIRLEIKEKCGARYEQRIIKCKKRSEFRRRKKLCFFRDRETE
jgi:hypothetical protein